MAKQLKKLIKQITPMFYMGGGSSKSTQPTAPDPYKTADAQLAANKQQSAYDAQLNRYTQNNPLGTVSWTNSGTIDNPNWTQNTTLSQPQQKLYDTQLGTQNTLAGQASDYASNRLPDALSGQIDSGDLATRQHVEDAMMERLNPSLQKDQDALTQQLANQGLTYGGDAYQRAMLDQSKRTNDARLAVVGAAGDEMSRTAGLTNSARNQAISEMAALSQGSGNVNLPTYTGSTTVGAGSPVDIAGLINANYQSQLAAANQKQAGKNGLMSGGMGALGTIGGAFASK